jgi:hypothetical protein
MTIFTITNNHLKLLKHIHISWNSCEFGAPTVDCKRPYGNSDVYCDIARILNIPIPDFDNDEDFTDQQLQYIDEIHKEMQTVLQIGVRVGCFEEGTFYCPDYTQDWREVL